MTANVFAEDRDNCLAAGMNDHVAKPFDPDRLFTLLAHWLRAAGTESDAGEHTAPTVEAGVSFERGLERCLNQPELYERALRTFLELERGTGAAIRSALANANHTAAAGLAHSTVSSAGAIGADALAAAARALQHAINSGESGRWQLLLDAFEREFEAVVADLTRHLGSATSSAPQ